MTFWLDVGMLCVFAFGTLVGWWARGIVARVRLAVASSMLIKEKREEG